MTDGLIYSIRVRKFNNDSSTERELAIIYNDRELARQTVQSALRVGCGTEVYLYVYQHIDGALNQQPAILVERTNKTKTETIHASTDY